MDIISHVLIGRIISFNKSRLTQIWTMVFSYLPDLFQVPAYIYLGYINNRMFLIPKNIDWNHARNLYPVLHALTWEIPHSIFFVLLIIFPVILYFKLPKIILSAYFIHILIDIPFHEGEWALKPFYPLNYSINGVANAWSWPIWAMVSSWIILILIIFSLNIFNKKNDRYLNKS